jgi:hypothetical protein
MFQLAEALEHVEAVFWRNKLALYHKTFTPLPRLVDLIARQVIDRARVGTPYRHRESFEAINRYTARSLF